MLRLDEKAKQVSVSLRPSEQKKLREFASRRGMTVSGYIRNLIYQEMSNAAAKARE
jgi:hypothetical protein